MLPFLQVKTSIAPELTIKSGSSWILVARVRFDFGLSTSEQGGGFLQASAPASNDLAADVETW